MVEHSSRRGVLNSILNLIILTAGTLNLLLGILSWSIWFEGDEHKVGAADKLFGSFRVSGFRLDFVWILVSSPILLFLFFYSARTARANKSATVRAAFCLLGLLGFLLLLYRLPRLLWFG